MINFERGKKLQNKEAKKKAKEIEHIKKVININLILI